MQKVYCPYIQSVIDHISNSYGESKLQALIDFYGSAQSMYFEGETNRSVPDIDGDDANAEWKFLHKILFKEYNNISMENVFSNLLTKDTIRAAFPNLVTESGFSGSNFTCHYCYSRKKL